VAVASLEAAAAQGLRGCCFLLLVSLLSAMSSAPLSMSAVEADAVLSSDLAQLPLSSFLTALSVRHQLGLSQKEVERSQQMLQEQWFTVAEGQPSTVQHTHYRHHLKCSSIGVTQLLQSHLISLLYLLCVRAPPRGR
jgi:hypothetical protein